MTGTDLFPIKQDQYSGRLEMVYTAVMPKPGYHYEYKDGTRYEVRNADPSIPIFHISDRLQHIVGGCAGTQYGCKDGRARTKEEFEADRKLTILPIAIPEIIKPLIEEDDIFEEILEAEKGGIKIGIGKGIITGIVVGIILLKVIK